MIIFKLYNLPLTTPILKPAEQTSWFEAVLYTFWNILRLEKLRILPQCIPNIFQLE